MNCTNKEIGSSIGLYEFNLLNEPEAAVFERHLVECDYCAEDLYRMQPVWTALKENPDIIVNPGDYVPERSTWLQMVWSKPVMAIASASFLVLMMVGIRHEGNDSSKLARLGAVEPEAGMEVRVRGAGDGEAVSPYMHVYQMGIMNLKEAERWVGQKIQIDSEKVARGEEYLHEAAKLASEMDDQTHMAECYLYLGKAALIKSNISQAQSYFEKIIELKQSGTQLLKLKRQASDLIEKINEIKR